MTFTARLLLLMLSGIIFAACSGTKTSDSWSDQNYKGQIRNVYIIGIAKSDLNRMIFEDTFEDRLDSEGINAVASYQDLLATNQEIDREDIIQRLRANNCDSVLLTRVVSQRKKSISTGRGSYRYSPGPAYRGGKTYTRPDYYNSWDTYYRKGTVSFTPPSSAEIVTLTLESVLYDLQTEELIWSAQFETHFEQNLENMMRIFVDEVTKDIKGKGLI